MSQILDFEMRREAMRYAAGDIAKAQRIYDFLRGAGEAPAAPAVETAKAEKPKATKAKVEKPADPPAETAYPDLKIEKIESLEAGEPLLDYAKDVQPKVIAAAARLQAAGLNGVQVLKPKLQDKYGVANAKDVPADKWPEMLVYIDTEATKAIKAASATGGA